MAMKGTLEADFSQFSQESKQAEADLRSLEKTSHGTANAIKTIEQAATKAVPGVTSLRQSYSQFDGVLSAAGVNAGPAVKAIEDIAAASGKTATQIGMLGTAGLVVGTFTAAFVTARSVIGAFFPDLDQWVADSTASLMGWGSAAQEAAGAVQDSINLALARTGQLAANANEALQLNTKWVKDRAKVIADTEEATKKAEEADKKWAAAVAEMVGMGLSWQETLAGMTAQTVAAVKAGLEHKTSHEAMILVLGVTKEQILKVAEAMAVEKKAADDAAAATAAAAKIIAGHWTDVGAILDQVFGVDQLQAATNWVDAVTAMGGSIAQLTNQQLADLQAAMLAGIDALARSGDLTSSQSSKFAELALAAGAALESIKGIATTTQDYTAAANEAAKANDDWIASMVDAQHTANDSAAAARDLKMARTQPASLVGVGLATPAGLRPTWAGQGAVDWFSPQSAAPVNVTVNYPIMNDPQAMDQLGRLVGDAVMQRSTRSGTSR